MLERQLEIRLTAVRRLNVVYQNIVNNPARKELEDIIKYLLNAPNQ